MCCCVKTSIAKFLLEAELLTMAAVPNMNVTKIQHLIEHNLWDISQFLDDEKWIKLGRQLRVTDAVLNKIEKENSNDYRECAYKMLKAWREKNPDSTLQDLFTVLSKMDWKLPIRQITEHFKMTTVQSHPAAGEPIQMSKIPDAVDSDRQVEPKKPGMSSSHESKASTILTIQLNNHNMWHILSQYLNNPNWIDVGRQLGISDTKLDEIQQGNPKNNRECAYQMLSASHECNELFTVQDLFIALQKLNLMSTIKDIEKCLSTYSSEQLSKQ